jgi:DNA-nicking Smr family endonuclease
MARGPRLTEADRAAWAGYAQHIAKLPGRAGPIGATPPPEPTAPPAPRPTPKRRAEPPRRTGPAASPLSIGGPPAGVDKSTWQRFRTGKLAAPRKLDLHGMTAHHAFQALTAFLRAAHADHVRCVEIVTGRGGGSGKGEGTGVLRREFPHWLNRPDIRPLILGAVHPHAANPGAVRLLLRRIR